MVRTRWRAVTVKPIKQADGVGANRVSKARSPARKSSRGAASSEPAV